MLTPEDVRTIRGRADAAGKVNLASAIGFMETVAPGALNALVGPARAKRELDVKSAEAQATLKDAAATKRARKAAKLKGLPSVGG